MTTIAVTRDQIAGDRQVTHSGGLKFKVTTKVHEFYQPLLWPKKFYVGMCGNVDEFPDILQFLYDPAAMKKAPKGNGGECVVLTEDRKIFTFKSPSKWIHVEQPFYAVGTGMNYAMSAMECGKTAIEAVKVASKFDLYTGMGVTHFDVEKPEKVKK
jgi:hypothetical protein